MKINVVNVLACINIVLKDLESVILENFGRTPATTQACSQTLEANDDSDTDTSSYDDIDQGRVRSMVN